jgi:hypothetical protein
MHGHLENQVLILKYCIMINSEHTEGKLTKTIENQTAKLPSDAFLFTAVGAMGVSLALRCLGKKDTSLFVGQWAAPILLMGIYNKLVKQSGHDETSNSKSRM